MSDHKTSGCRRFSQHVPLLREPSLTLWHRSRVRVNNSVIVVADGVPEMEIAMELRLVWSRSGQSDAGPTQVKGMGLVQTKIWDCNRGKKYKSSFFHDNNHSG